MKKFLFIMAALLLMLVIPMATNAARATLSMEPAEPAEVEEYLAQRSDLSGGPLYFTDIGLQEEDILITTRGYQLDAEGKRVWQYRALDASEYKFFAAPEGLFGVEVMPNKELGSADYIYEYVYFYLSEPFDLKNNALPSINVTATIDQLMASNLYHFTLQGKGFSPHPIENIEARHFIYKGEEIKTANGIFTVVYDYITSRISIAENVAIDDLSLTDDYVFHFVCGPIFNVSLQGSPESNLWIAISANDSPISFEGKNVGDVIEAKMWADPPISISVTMQELLR